MIALRQGVRVVLGMHHCPARLVPPSRVHLGGPTNTPCPHSRTATFGSPSVVAGTCNLDFNLEPHLQHPGVCARATKRTNSRCASPVTMSRDPKPCQTCGREITWRKKWVRCWDEIKYCSDGCRKNKPGDEGRCALLTTSASYPKNINHLCFRSSA